MEVFAVSIIGGKNEQKALEILKNNAKAVTEVVRKFEEVVKAYFTDGDIKKAECLGRELSKLETKADGGRRDFIAMLSQGAFLPAFRGDLAWLAERLDRVADTAEGAMRVLLIRKQLFDALKKAGKKSRKIEDIKDRLRKMAGTTTETVELLQEAVEALTANIDDALRKARDVDNLEHQVDLIEGSLINDIYELEKLFDPLSVFQLIEFIRRFGNITDRAEDMSDSMTILAMTITA
ncbi:MAG: TIGR00153 family protein [Candidatus Hadarchaeales archaeon]